MVRDDAFPGCELSGEQAVVLHLSLPLEQSLFRTVLRDACFLCYTDEGRSLQEEGIFNHWGVFVEAQAFARTSGWCCWCCHPVTQPSFCICVLEWGRGRASHVHQLLYEQNPFLSLRGGWGRCRQGARLSSVPAECLASRIPAVLAPRTARNGVMLAKGQSDAEPEATWRKEARIYMFSLMKGFPVAEGAFLDCIWYFLSSSKPDPPCSNSRHFHSGYLWRERCAGEN